MHKTLNPFQLDYQFCFWNTPGADVFALLCNVSEESVRQNHRQEVIHKYFKIFQETLVKLGYNRELPRLLDLQMELLRCGLLEYMYYLVFVPFQHLDFSKLDINKMMENMDFHAATKDILNSKEFRETFLKRLTYMIDMGVLE